MMNDEDLRDCFAMFALNGIIARGGLHPELMPEDCIARRSYELADAMIEARNKTIDDGGITTIKKRKYVRKD
jgi:hypothetical protein